jgi:curved DNA-binding protein
MALPDHYATLGIQRTAKLDIGLEDSYLGAKRMFSIPMPTADATGHATLQNRQFELSIPKGIREGQNLRLSGLGDAGQGGAPAGDLYLEVGFLPHPLFRVSGGDISFDLPLAPWEAALGASVEVPTPDHSMNVLLKVPPGSPQGRKLRLKGRGLPGKVPGDLYAVLGIVLPVAASEADHEAYSALARAFASFQPRAAGLG